MASAVLKIVQHHLGTNETTEIPKDKSLLKMGFESLAILKIKDDLATEYPNAAIELHQLSDITVQQLERFVESDQARPYDEIMQSHIDFIN